MKLRKNRSNNDKGKARIGDICTENAAGTGPDLPRRSCLTVFFLLFDEHSSKSL
jgi:hypothetical protein